MFVDVIVLLYIIYNNNIIKVIKGKKNIGGERGLFVIFQIYFNYFLFYFDMIKGNVKICFDIYYLFSIFVENLQEKINIYIIFF